MVGFSLTSQDLGKDVIFVNLMGDPSQGLSSGSSGSGLGSTTGERPTHNLKTVSDAKIQSKKGDVQILCKGTLHKEGRLQVRAPTDLSNLQAKRKSCD